MKSHTAVVSCDECGQTTTAADVSDSELPMGFLVDALRDMGWSIDDDADMCPDCSKPKASKRRKGKP